MAAIDRVPGLSQKAATLRRLLQERLAEHSQDVPEIRNGTWPH